MKMKKVSIVIPVCNRKKEVVRAVNSVLRQSYRKIEIIIVENNSTDPNKIKNEILSLSPSKIYFYSLGNCDNANIARNFGSMKASGYFIAYLDSDDSWDENHLENCIHVMDRDEADFVYGAAKINNGKKIIYRKARKLNEKESPIDYLLGFRRGFAQTSSYMIKKSLWEKVKWNNDLKRHQDYDFFMRAFDAGKFSCNENYDYTIHWQKGEKRSFDFQSLKEFFKESRSRMSVLTEFRYILIMIKTAKKNNCYTALNYYVKQALLFLPKRILKQL